MADPRTFTFGDRGDDVRAWQQHLVDRFRAWDIDYPLEVDGSYGAGTRAATASFMRAWGVENVGEAMEHGLTVWWRTKLRDDRRNAIERNAFEARVEYRRNLRNRYAGGGVAMPVAKVLADSWGWHPGVHDGLDLICPVDAPIFAMCDGEIIRADASGWWGLGAKPSPGHPVSDGDGVIVLRCTTEAGPFNPGLNLVYGHAEHATVKAGQKVRAGQQIGKAGFANASHIHLCVNGRSDAKGVGDRDPQPFYDFVRRNA